MLDNRTIVYSMYKETITRAMSETEIADCYMAQGNSEQYKVHIHTANTLNELANNMYQTYEKLVNDTYKH
jgi:hypothetical protein